MVAGALEVWLTPGVTGGMTVVRVGLEENRSIAMRILQKVKDGGPTSPVDSYTLVEIKSLFSVMALKFNKGGRENYHTHAFNAFTWFIAGNLIEEDISGTAYRYKRSIFPKLTKRTKNHRVKALKDSWCFTIRGPWEDVWTEHTAEMKKVKLTHGRKVIE